MASALAGCSGNLSALDPAGPSARSIAWLWWVMLAGSTLLFALVLGLLWASYRQPRWITSTPAGKWIIRLGLIMPAIVLTMLVYAALIQGEMLLPRDTGIEPIRILAVASQWQWQFSYPGIPGAVASTNLLHLPAGQPVDIVVSSRDVIHSFWVPQLGGKMDAIPGHENVIRLEADEPGRYGGVCSEFCGTGHASMHFTALAHPAEAFAAAVRGTP
jgi:cytochrome c oxidase subunit 2